MADESREALENLIKDNEEWSKTHTIARVQFCYAVELPEGYDRNDEKQKGELLEKFVKENVVSVTEDCNGYIKQYSKMKDGRCENFDFIEID